MSEEMQRYYAERGVELPSNVSSESDESYDKEEATLWIKDQGLTMMEFIDARVPKGSEASLAKTKIEEAVMWAVKGLVG